MSTQTAAASAGTAGPTFWLRDHWIARVEFDNLLNELRAAGVPENGVGPATIEQFILYANVAAVSQEQFDDEEWQLKKLALAKRGAAAMIAAVQPRAAKTAASPADNESKRAREEDGQSTSPGSSTGAPPPGKKPKVEVDPDVEEARLRAASSAMELEESRKFQQLWLESGTSESRVMTPLLMKMSNALKALNYQLTAVAKHVLQFDGQLCELSCEQFADAGFVEELSFDELPATVREHLDATAVRLEKVRAAAADLTRGFTTQCRFFWCANHRPGCDWRTIEQIQHRRGADAWNGAMDDSVVPIESWNDQIAAAMLDLNQHAPCNKDGKAVGSICPFLRAAAADRGGRFGRDQNGRGGGNGGGRQGGRRGRGGGGGRQGGRNYGRGGGRGGARGAGGDRPGSNRGAPNKENRAPANAGDGAPAAAAPAAAGGG